MVWRGDIDCQVRIVVRGDERVSVHIKFFLMFGPTQKNDVSKMAPTNTRRQQANQAKKKVCKCKKNYYACRQIEHSISLVSDQIPTQPISTTRAHALHVRPTSHNERKKHSRDSRALPDFGITRVDERG